MKKLFFLLLLIPFELMGSPQGVPRLTTATVGTSPSTALAANPYRGYLIIQNQGNGTCIMNFGTAVVTPDGIEILPGQNYEVVEGFIKSLVSIQCNRANTKFVFLETNY